MNLQQTIQHLFIYINPSLQGEEGNFTIQSRVLDNKQNIVFTGNKITVNKKNILNNILQTINAENGLTKIVIVNETDRYFEDNQTNRELVQQIKEKTDGIYLIYNDVSPVLEPLLEK